MIEDSYASASANFESIPRTPVRAVKSPTKPQEAASRTTAMKFRLASLVFALLVGGALPAPGVAKTSDPPAARVMVLGVAHLTARRDVHNSAFEDSPLSPRRQAQIEDVVRRLARFRPTKVLVEVQMGNTTFPREYRQYLAGHLSLCANEVCQFGFRLAALAGDATIYPIDTWGPQIYDDKSAAGKRVDAYLEAHLPSVTTPAFAAFLAGDDALERDGTYLELLRYLNTDVAIRANASAYSVIDSMGRGTDEAGALYVAGWYTRNCYIFSNIASVVRPGDRVVVMMGQGHEYLLREFVRMDPNMQGVDPLNYLR